LVKNIINNNAYKSDNITKIRVNNKLISNPSDIANNFNEYFTSIGPNLAKSIPKSNGNYRDFLDLNRMEQSFFLNPITSAEIILTVNEFESNKASGHDNISPKVIKKIIPQIADQLSTIFNKSFTNGIFPDSLKTARVSPIHKSEDKLLINNYRPISILPFFSKILEKLMHNRLVTFLNSHNLLTDKQFGFLENRSTALALVNVIDKISQALDKKVTIGIF